MRPVDPASSKAVPPSHPRRPPTPPNPPPLPRQAAIYFGNDYVTLPEWFSLGFVYGVLSLVIVIGLGFPWWKFLGWC